ncbi:MAG TPA: GNAT family N-acetyltransferase [Nocardioidaceae bacterium]
MDELTELSDVEGDLVQAVQTAGAAALAAGVSVRNVEDLAELEQVVTLFASIWGRDANPPMTLELLRAFTKAGNYVGGAFEGQHLVGACVGFFHAPAEDALHSHIAGVAAGMTGRNIGFALKLHQRSWAMVRGVSEIAWTFDPLVSRNAYFNLSKLCAQPVEYLPNFYGPMLDTINGVDDSDRLLVRWRLRDPSVVAACAGRGKPTLLADLLAAGATVGLDVGDDGAPKWGSLEGETVLVTVPQDIGALRDHDPAVAAQWRAAVREALAALLADGACIDGFDRTGSYVVRRHR